MKTLVFITIQLFLAATLNLELAYSLAPSSETKKTAKTLTHAEKAKVKARIEKALTAKQKPSKPTKTIQRIINLENNKNKEIIEKAIIRLHKERTDETEDPKYKHVDKLADIMSDICTLYLAKNKKNKIIGYAAIKPIHIDKTTKTKKILKKYLIQLVVTEKTENKKDWEKALLERALEQEKEITAHCHSKDTETQELFGNFDISKKAKIKVYYENDDAYEYTIRKTSSTFITPESIDPTANPNPKKISSWAFFKYGIVITSLASIILTAVLILMGLTLSYALLIGFIVWFCSTIILIPVITFFINRTMDKEYHANQTVFTENLSKNLSAHVYKLAGHIGARNIGIKDKIDDTEKYITKKLTNYGYTVETQPHKITQEKNKDQTVNNLIATLPGSDLEKEEILVVANYDTKKQHPGADNNASGIAGLLELARLMKHKEPKRTIKFIAVANGAPPFLNTNDMGSRVYAKNAKEKKDKIKAVIALKMIGYYTNKPFSQEYVKKITTWWSTNIKILNWFFIPIANELIIPGLNGILKLFFPNRGNYIAVIGNLKSQKITNKATDAFKKRTNFPIQKTALPFASTFSYAHFADHSAFWQQNYPAVVVTDTAGLRNPNYFNSDAEKDTPETLNYENMAEVVNGLSGSLDELSGIENENLTKRTRVFKAINIKTRLNYIIWSGLILASISFLVASIFIGKLFLILPAIGVFLIITILFLIKILMIGVIERSLVYPGQTLEKPAPPEFLKKYEDITFYSSDDTKLRGKYIPTENSKGTVLLCYGNTGKIESMEKITKFFHNLNLDVFLYDHRGYGKSKGKTNESGIYLDADAAYEQMKKSYKEHHGKQLQKEKILIMGHSLGAAVANYLAYTKDAGAFISMSGFSCIKDVVKYKTHIPGFLIKLFADNTHNAAGRIKDIKMPKLIIHAKNDQIIDYRMAEKLYNASKQNDDEENNIKTQFELLEEIEEARGHNLVPILDATKEIIIKFLQENINSTIEPKVLDEDITTTETVKDQA